jgi:GR25 family glycosyltransferase involved in LPS biosynthesis
MRMFVINLARAQARRQRMHQQLIGLGLEAKFHAAVDGLQLTNEQYDQVDRDARRRMGLKPQADGSIANWLSQRQVMQQVVKNGPEIIAIFEDDVELSPDLPPVLAELERSPLAFDVIKLNRRTPAKPFVPCMQLSTGHRIGRVRYHDFGCEGYVITRAAARRFLAATPKMMWEIDQAINYYWDNGLNVLYLDPPVVFHVGQDDSQIEADRSASREQYRNSENPVSVLWRRGITGARRYFVRRRAFRQRIQEDEMGIRRK